MKKEREQVERIETGFPIPVPYGFRNLVEDVAYYRAIRTGEVFALAHLYGKRGRTWYAENGTVVPGGEGGFWKVYDRQRGEGKTRRR
jgi:hypothetical protein